MPGGIILEQLQNFAGYAAEAAIVVGVAKWLLTRELEYRKALGRGLIRENGLVSCCDKLVFAIDHLEDPPPSVLKLRAQALIVLEDAQRQSHGKERQ